MAAAREIQTRIKSIQDTMKITSAMYMISSAKLKKARKNLENTEPYFEMLQSTIARIVRHLPEIEHRYFEDAQSEKRTQKKRGYIVVAAAGDGIDANGSITMNDGTVIVNGPENGGNGALDYDTTFDINGGTFVAAGSSQMAQGPSDSSTQASINVSLATSYSESIVSVLDSNGNIILSFIPAKTCDSIIISSPKLTVGSDYSLYCGGSSTGTETNGLYTEGTVSGGSELTSFTLSSSIMTVSSSGATEGISGSMGMPGGMGGQGGMQGTMPGGMPQR